MQSHTKEYFTKLGLSPHAWNPCELCGQTLVDVHHIRPRSMFGSRRKNADLGNQDHVDNLIGLCRQCHDNAHGSALIRRAVYANIEKAIEARKLHIGLL